MNTNHPQNPYQHYLEGGGEMGELIRSYNWSATTLGHQETWSQQLLTIVNLIINSGFPMFIGPLVIARLMTKPETLQA